MMAAVIRGLDSGEWVMWLEKNCLQFFQVSLRKKVSWYDPKESDEYQYRIQNTDTGEITERAEMRNRSSCGG